MAQLLCATAASVPAAAALWSRRGRRQLLLPAGALSRREALVAGGASAAVLGVGSGGVAAAASAAGSQVAAEAQTQQTLPLELDQNGVQRLALQPDGWNKWSWRGHNINYLSSGERGPVVLLMHGFGASVYHWRYNVPELAKNCRVYAMDCLGFGWSDKPVVDYGDYAVWRDQIADFIREVVGEGERVVLVGNSLGGYNVLSAAAEHPDLVRGVVLLNAAGRFQDAAEAAEEAAAAARQQTLWGSLTTSLASSAKRAVVFASFVFTKQPARIRQVLQQVYLDPTNIDEDLVRSISLPAQNPNAPEVFYRIITGRGEPMNKLLDRLAPLRMPVFLLWGERDPWCVPARATQIQKYYPTAERVDILSGHCPHDDTPSLVNGELLRWVAQLPQ